MSTSTVVAISRQFGSGGARVGREVAQRLGLRYADREILAEAARTLQVETDDLQPLEERVRSFWERLGDMFGKGAVDTPFMPPPLPVVSPRDLFAVERQIIRTLAAEGNAVIVGRGAAHVLSGQPGVIRVFLHAPLESRVALAIEEYDLADHDAALALVRQSDAQRARFVQEITGHEWCDATLYDATLNTALTGLDRAVDLIVDLIRRPTGAQAPAPMPQPSAGGRA